MKSYINEDDLEKDALREFQKLNYKVYKSESYTSPNKIIDKMRNNNHYQTILPNELRKALVRINGNKYKSAIYTIAVEKMKHLADNPNLLANNHQMHQFLVNGIKVSYTYKGQNRAHVLYPINFNNINNNSFIATDQFTVRKNVHTTFRPDITLFINGLPLVTFELKNPANPKTDISDAYTQLQTYKVNIPEYMKYNEILIISDDEKAQAGSLTAGFDRFMPWRSPNYANETTPDSSQLTTLIKYMLNKKTLLNIINNFILFESGEQTPIKILAAYHQYYMVNKVVQRAKATLNDPTKNKIGTVWHTQGSGKSLAMVFFAQIISKVCNPTIILLNDRNDLDEQLDHTFASASEYLRQSPHHIDNGRDLETELSRARGGIYFTTIQKFSPDENQVTMPILSKRQDIIVIADEAHRSQYGLRAKYNYKKGLSFGFAKYMRDALPNASFIGFTGTPINEEGKSTKAVFGNYIDIYDMTQAVKDHMTVKIYYENREVPLSINKNVEKRYKKLLNQSQLNENSLNNNEKRKRQLTRLSMIAGAQPRVNKIAKDFVHHFEARYKKEHGKAIFVSMSRPNAVKIFNAIVKLRPSWASNDINKGIIKIVMTSAASDGKEMEKHHTTKSQRELLQKRMKDPNDSLKIVIVVSMWLTGFDAPDVNTMYIDKPMHGHNLMQAIARINRVFKNKTGALVVDYIGIAGSLRQALKYYSTSDKNQVGIDTKQVAKIMMETYHIIEDFLSGADYSNYQSSNKEKRIQCFRGAINYLLKTNNTTELKRFCDRVVQMQKAFSLIPISNIAHKISPRASFFVAIKSAILKIEDPNTTGMSEKRLNYHMKQLLDESIIPGDPRDLYDELGLKHPNIDLLSAGFLKEISQMKEKNLAENLMERLIKGQVRSMRKTNLTQSEHFDVMLKKAVDKYNERGLTTEAIINELIKMAKEIDHKRKEGQKLGLSPEEKAFYDALAHHKEAVQVLGDKKLHILAKLLVKDVKKHAFTDWTRRRRLKALMKVSVKRSLKRFHYPPDFSRDATNRVVKQAEITAKSYNS